MRLRATGLLLVLVSLATAVAAEPGAPTWRGRGPQTHIFVPLDPIPPGIWWMHRHDRRLVPPTVSIGGEPYVCDVDARSFATRDAFVAHLRWEHALSPERIPGLLYRADGEVHYAGE